ncbi:MAG: class I SAM-dependent methyltransferase, partial [Acetobacteraceae bacterium]|nr:class I SAM-dependent methyltransferase [Acetobacteraceae bacterium]
RNVKVDLVHLDGGHDYRSVMADLQAWWPLVRPGGILIGDDYNTNGVWPEVRQAFDEFFGQLRLTPFEVLILSHSVV